MKKRLNQKGLTLIELLAVVVILGIISAIAVPSIGGIISNTQNKATVAEAIQIVNAAKLANATSADIPTGGWTFTGSAPTDYSATTGTFIDISQYLENVENEAFVVYYTSNEYRIYNHPSVALAGTTGAAYATEAQLIDYAK